MLIKRSVDGLRASAQKKHQEALDKTERGIQQLIKEKRVINFNTVAEASGVSKAWLYKEVKVRERIEHLRCQTSSQGKTPPKSRASEQSLKAMIQNLKGRLKKLEAENRDLRQQNEVAYGQVVRVRELERQITRLEEENKRLRGRANPAPIKSPMSDIRASLQALGVEMNSTLDRLINETPEGIVSTAIGSLKEAVTTGKVQNPGGFLNKAIRDAWRPNESYQDKADMEEFNQWWKWAYKEGLVKAATQIDGIQHVLTREDTWKPFEEAARLHPKHLDSTFEL